MVRFRETLDAERLRVQGSNDMTSLLQGGGHRSKGVVVKIRRSRVLEDGMAALDKIGSDIKDRVVVRYINEFGEEEAGIDAGGLFKDFLTDLSARVFNPSYVSINFVLFSYQFLMQSLRDISVFVALLAVVVRDFVVLKGFV
jgi:hypothetical protein